MSINDQLLLIPLALCLLPCGAVSQPVLALGTEGVAQGNAVSLPMWLMNSTNLVGLQFEIGFDPQSVRLNDVRVASESPGIFADGVLALSNRFRVVLVSTNRSALSNGLLASLSFAAPADAPNGAIRLPLRHLPGNRTVGATT